MPHMINVMLTSKGVFNLDCTLLIYLSTSDDDITRFGVLPLELSGPNILQLQIYFKSMLLSR